MAAALRDRLAAARHLNEVLRGEVNALNKRTKKVEGRIARIASLTAKLVVPPPPPVEDANAAHDPAPVVDASTPAAPAAVVAESAAAVSRAVVFDFDKCLMKNHWWGDYRNRPIEGINPQPTDFGHSNITALFESILAVEGVLLAVASFGRHDVIKKAITSAIGAEKAEGVFVTTPGDFPGYVDGCSMGAQYKNTELTLIMDTYNVAAEDIIFFDDSKDNVKHAQKMGCTAHVVMPFTDDHVPHINAFLGVEL